MPLFPFHSASLRQNFHVCFATDFCFPSKLDQFRPWYSIGTTLCTPSSMCCQANQFLGVEWRALSFWDGGAGPLTTKQTNTGLPTGNSGDPSAASMHWHAGVQALPASLKQNFYMKLSHTVLPSNEILALWEVWDSFKSSFSPVSVYDGLSTLGTSSLPGVRLSSPLSQLSVFPNADFPNFETAFCSSLFLVLP